VISSPLARQHNQPTQSGAFAVPLLPGQTEADRTALI
jgi:hypothetical protein